MNILYEIFGVLFLDYREDSPSTTIKNMHALFPTKSGTPKNSLF